jgi:hypothetical protein
MTEIKRFLVQAFRVDDSAEILVLAVDVEEAWRIALRHLQGTKCEDVLDDRRNRCSPTGGLWRHGEILETTMSPEPQRVELRKREDLGWKLHTALRKGCDSKASSLVWLMVDDPDYGDAWNTYLDLAWVALCRLESLDRDDIAVALAGAAQAMDDLWTTGSRQPKGVRQFRLALELLGRDDWQGMTYGLIDDDEMVTP